ncbi:hypothetical protein FHW67_001536 [Herbaspirillum sp. Sphag1AN]|nr:hypothetical protein [Herbaspirillum sp. Sphag1AN]MBB3245646.1 hypothetical protein [Herbaspirillum sp. Sphag64]
MPPSTATGIIPALMMPTETCAAGPVGHRLQ